MAQSTILAANTTSATSTDIVLAAGARATVGIFASAAGAQLPADVVFHVYMDTPGADNPLDILTNTGRQVAITGPGTIRVVRPAYTGTAFGVFLEKD